MFTNPFTALSNASFALLISDCFAFTFPATVFATFNAFVTAENVVSVKSAPFSFSAFSIEVCKPDLSVVKPLIASANPNFAPSTCVFVAFAFPNIE